MSKKNAKRICFVTIASDGTLEDVEPIRASPGTTVLFVLSNEHPTDDIKVEIADFKRRETMTAANPIATGGPHRRTLSPGEVESLKLMLHPKARFGDPGAGLLPYTTYKYSVLVTNATAGSATVTYDPDLDVPPA